MDEQLKRDAVRGAGWAFFSSVSVRLSQITATLVLAKLLMPADFGVFSLASIITYAMTLFSELGFSRVLIYLQGDMRRRANTAFVLSTATNTVLAVLLAALAPVIGRAFSAPEITAPVRVMAGMLIISGAATVPQALMDKELKFKRRAVAEVSSAFTYTAVSVGLAAAGFRVWSMVIGWTAMTLVNAGTTWALCQWRPSIEFSKEDSRVIVNYGKHLLTATLAAFIFIHIDKAAVGRWLGMSALGFYSVAFTVCNMPATNLTSVVNRVMFPTYAKLNNNMQEIRSVYLSTIRHLSAATFPAVAGLVVLSDPVIRVLYGHKWEEAIPLFHILAFYGLVRAIGATEDAVFMSTGHPELVRRVSLIQLLTGLLLVYPVAKAFGVAGVAVLFTTAYFAGIVYGFSMVRRILDMSTVRWLEVVWVPLVSSASAGLVAWLGADALGRPTWGTLALTGAMLGCTYGLSIFLLDRSMYSGVRTILAKAGLRGVPIPMDRDSKRR